MIFNYNRYLINESVISLSPLFIESLKLIDSPISKKLIEVNETDIEKGKITMVDIVNDSDQFLSFSTGAKTVDKYRIKDIDEIYQTHTRIFREWGFKNQSRNDRVSVGDIGQIVRSGVVNGDGAVASHFIGDNGEECLITDYGIEKISTHKMSNIRSGRLIRNICDSIGYKPTDSEIETFVNKYRAVWSLVKGGLYRFRVVSGIDIANWYNENKYESQAGNLGNSCMKYEKCSRYLQIYCMNPEVVSMLVLSSKLDDHKICGRAILWNLSSPEGVKFMDRIYTNKDSDVELFKEWARMNDYYYKSYQNHQPGEQIMTPTGKEYINLVVNVKKIRYDYFPYMDTMRYYDSEDGRLSNIYDSDDDELVSTNGGSVHRNG